MVPPLTYCMSLVGLLGRPIMIGCMTLASDSSTAFPNRHEGSCQAPTVWPRDVAGKTATRPTHTAVTAQSVERDVVGVNSTLLDAARRAGSTSAPA